MTTKIIPIAPLRSANITEGKSRAPNRSMYYGMGYKESDFGKPMVGVAKAGRRGHCGH
jgi:dihydroxy-acid dehydratase